MLHASNRQDKNTIFEWIFILQGTCEETRRCIQISSMGWVLCSPQHFRSKLSLSCRCRKPNVEGRAQWEQNGRNETKCIDPEWSNMQQKVKNEGENPPIYNKILGHSRSWCMIKIMLTKSRSTFYGIFYYICWREKVFDLGQIPLFVNNK